MAKNTRSSEFRRVDVDQYLDEKYRDDDGDEEGAAKNGTAGIGPNNADVQDLLTQYP